MQRIRTVKVVFPLKYARLQVREIILLEQKAYPLNAAQAIRKQPNTKYLDYYMTNIFSFKLSGQKLPKNMLKYSLNTKYIPGAVFAFCLSPIALSHFSLIC